MSTLRALRPLVTLILLQLSIVACGDGGTGPGGSAATTIQVATPTLAFDIALSTGQIGFTVLDQDGQPMPNATTTFSVGDERIVSVSRSGLVTALANGSTDVTVASGSASATVRATVDVVPVALTFDEPVTLSSPIGGYRYFSIEVPAGAQDQILEVRLSGGSGDADLFLRLGSRVSFGAWDCGSESLFFNLETIEACSVRAPSAGRWHVAVEAFAEYSGVILEARLVPVTTLADGVPEVGIEGGPLSLRYFTIDVPQGSTLTLSTSLGSGDPDLFAADASIFAFPRLYQGACASFEDGTVESCAIGVRNEDESWTVVLFGFTAYSGVTLTADVGP